MIESDRNNGLVVASFGYLSEFFLPAGTIRGKPQSNRRQCAARKILIKKPI
jgi:hypothetical protein